MDALLTQCYVNTYKTWRTGSQYSGREGLALGLDDLSSP